MSILRHYLTLALEQSGVRVDRDVESELSDMDAAVARTDKIPDLEKRVRDLEARLDAHLGAHAQGKA